MHRNRSTHAGSLHLHTHLTLLLLNSADTNWDYGGSCGRCYEVRCKNGLVLDKGAPVSTAQFFDMGKANPNYRDTKGRKWPGGCHIVWAVVGVE